ncbi:WS/DGAT domain-containing protein [Gordonia hydrophobica]|uniref:WS/DGAT domain-containing protein n=1 Tax=Gordonia hydrophobica TaxID=40516 RepID=A0ABZ2U241_9ACTN|nr:WS/DGAT domain-containing protein [Gordonia hydrophobica]MBM7366847.1 hypothetical protein [Gordonia hydrophobica]
MAGSRTGGGALSGPDAGMYWRSLHAPNDQFLLYAFACSAGHAGDPMTELRARAAHIVDLHLGIERTVGDLAYPRWMHAPIVDDQWRQHDVDHWDDVLATVSELMAPGARDPESLWRVHLFGPLTGVPGAAGAARVVVLQISHALGDGRRVSAIARRLLADGAPDVLPRPRPVPSGVVAGLGAALTVPRLVAATAVGLAAWRVEEPSSGVPAIEPTALNLPDDGPATLRTVTVDRDGLRRRAPSVTVAVLAGLADVLGRFDGATADGRVVAEVTVARAPTAGQRNNFHTVGVDLRADLGPADRARAIADQLDAARRRDDHAARRTARRAAALTPAVLESLAVRLADRAPLPIQVAGATVVSSVSRGPADLTLGGGAVLFTAGFPALSPIHGLTHGVHGIGDRVTISLAAQGHAARRLDAYVDAVATALG